MRKSGAEGRTFKILLEGEGAERRRAIVVRLLAVAGPDG